MEGIVLAGGKGTRLKKIIKNTPKPLASINDKPFLAYLLTHLARKGFKKIILSVGYKSEKIISHFGDNFSNIDISYNIEESPLGTGGAIKESLKLSTSPHIFVLNGDTFLDFDPKMMLKIYKKTKKAIIAIKKVHEASKFGSLEIKHGKILKYKEKAKMRDTYINAGCYLLKKNFFKNIELNNHFSFEKEILTKKFFNKFHCYKPKGDFIDIGSPEDFMESMKVLKKIKF